MLEFRRGKQHIAKANEARKDSGTFTPFLSNIYWKDDDETKYVWILNPIDDIPMIRAQKVWTSNGRSETTIARTDTAIGASKDPIEEKWGYGPQEMNVCVAVELEATFEIVNGRKRPSGFEVKTRTFDRRVRNAKGELTDAREEVTTPVIGMIVQSPANFFNHVASQDANVAPIHEKAARITRIGTGSDTEYDVEIFGEKTLDMTNLMEFIDGVSYLGDEMDELLVHVDELLEDNQLVEAATLIGETILNRRLNEMGSEDNYNAILESIDAVARYPSKKFKSETADVPARTERPRRASQRVQSPTEDVAETSEAPMEETEEVKEAPRTRRSRTDRDDVVSKDSSVRDRLQKARDSSKRAA